jgi:uncharacterized protein YqgC (DUF456 family)
MGDVASRTSTIGAVIGVVLGIFRLLTSVWIPTLSLLFAVGAVALGLTHARHASGSRRSLAKLATMVGLAAVLLTIAIVVLTTGSSSGSVSETIAPPM